MLKLYFEILSIHLTGKKWKKYYRLIVYHLDCVNKGYKPSLLWDIGPRVDMITLENLIQALKASDLLCPYIYLATIEEEKFIINLLVVSKYLNEFLSNVRIVDCSSLLENPVMISPDQFEKVMFMLNFIKQKLFDFWELHKQQTSVSNLSLRLDIENDVIQCPPTIFGILLGYPVVYWASDVMNGNCLSNIPLDVYKIRINYPSTSEFKNVYDLYSFSVPACLNLDEFVDTWLMKLRETTDVDFQLFKNTAIQSCIQL